jgi:hypothetical protein
VEEEIFWICMGSEHTQSKTDNHEQFGGYICTHALSVALLK